MAQNTWKKVKFTIYMRGKAGSGGSNPDWLERGCAVRQKSL
jgi:hypothetical protein